MKGARCAPSPQAACPKKPAAGSRHARATPGGIPARPDRPVPARRLRRCRAPDRCAAGATRSTTATPPGTARRIQILRHGLSARPDLGRAGQPNGTQGWAVGGFVDKHNEALDTADVERYPAERRGATGLHSAAVQPNADEAALNATRRRSPSAAAPAAWRRAPIAPTPGSDPTCGSRARLNARRNPGVRAFFYTGPRVTSGVETTACIPLTTDRSSRA